MKVVHRSPKQVVQHWIKALRSGKYKQAKSQLKANSGTPKEGFCCLGVLCDLNYKDGGAKWEHESIYFDNNDNSSYFPKVIQEYVGLADKEVELLVGMNDTKHKSFTEIAEYIQINILPKHKD